MKKIRNMFNGFPKSVHEGITPFHPPLCRTTAVNVTTVPPIGIWVSPAFPLAHCCDASLRAHALL